MRTKVKQIIRGRLDRTLRPYFDRQVTAIESVLTTHFSTSEPIDATQIPAPIDLPTDPVLIDFNHLFHELRTIELRSLEVQGRDLLSAGCAGRWYFDWIDSTAGQARRHIGVELYSPEPVDLPPNVEWIAASASQMPAVADESIDVLFSGQNLEHLWINDMVGFFKEANRVLRPGATLVLDSPNRLATEAMGWVQPEHTIEMSAAEATHLLLIAGFSVRTTRGLWRCQAADGSWLGLQAPPNDVRALLDRAAGRFDVDASFSWWIEAEKTEIVPDPNKVEQAVVALFDQHWASRVTRGAAVRQEKGDRILRTHGFPIFAGAYSVSAGNRGVRLYRSDGSLICEGTNLTGQLPATEFGVCCEVDLEANELTARIDVQQFPI
jgi:SAM-dependent methyltransferase